MSFIGINEAILITAAVIALIWGPKKLPELARSIGRSKHEYKQAADQAKEEYEDIKPDAESEMEASDTDQA